MKTLFVEGCSCGRCQEKHLNEQFHNEVFAENAEFSTLWQLENHLMARLPAQLPLYAFWLSSHAP